jgi:hypothetical protein
LIRPEVETDLLKKLGEARFKDLVAQITTEMQGVTSDLKAINTFRARQRDLESAIASLTDDINSDDTRVLFEQIAREAGEQPPSSHIFSGINASYCDVFNGTDAGGDNPVNCASSVVTSDAGTVSGGGSRTQP